MTASEHHNFLFIGKNSVTLRILATTLKKNSYSSTHIFDLSETKSNSKTSKILTSTHSHIILTLPIDSHSQFESLINNFDLVINSLTSNSRILALFPQHYYSSNKETLKNYQCNIEQLIKKLNHLSLNKISVKFILIEDLVGEEFISPNSSIVNYLLKNPNAQLPKRSIHSPISVETACHDILKLAFSSNPGRECVILKGCDSLDIHTIFHTLYPQLLNELNNVDVFASLHSINFSKLVPTPPVVKIIGSSIIPDLKKLAVITTRPTSDKTVKSELQTYSDESPQKYLKRKSDTNTKPKSVTNTQKKNRFSFFYNLTNIRNISTNHRFHYNVAYNIPMVFIR